MSEYVYAGLTSQTIDVVLYDSSTGLPMTGLAYNTAGLKAYYRKGATGTATAITLATQTVGGAWSSGGFVQIDSTNMKGHYRLDLPNAAVDTAGFVTICISGATDLAQLDQRIDCRPLPVDVKQFGGTNGTFSSGRPEVNATHVSGTSQTAGDLATLITTVDTVVDAVKAKTDNLPTDPADASDIATSFSTVNTKLDTIDDFLDTEVAAIKAKTDNLPADPADASDIATSFGTVNSTLSTISGYLDTEIAAIKAKTDNLPADPADASDIASAFSTVNTKLDTIDTVVDSILVDTDVIGIAGAGLTAIPWNVAWDAEVQSECADALTAYDPPTRAELTTDTNSILTAVGDVPTNAELATALASADDAVLAAVGTVDTVVDAIKVKTDQLVFTIAGQVDANALSGGGSGLDAAGVRAAIGLASANLDTQLSTIDTVVDAIKVTTDKLDDTLEDDAGTYRFSVNALEQAPSGGGGGSTDWTADERTAIRTILGVPASGTTPDVPSAGALKVIDDLLDTEVAAIKAKTDNLPSDPADASDISTAFGTVNTTLSTIAGYLDTEIAAIKAKTDNLPADPADASDIAASFSTVNSTLSTIAGYLDTEVAAIKAKTDNLPADPADASDIAAAFSTVNTKLDTIDGIVDSILVDTAVIGAAGAGLTSIPWNASWDAEVQSECTDALNAYDPPTRAELTTDTNSVLTAVGDVPTNAELATALAAADDAVLAAVGTVDTVVDAIKAVTDKIDTGLVLDGAVYQFTASMLELGPSGSGGGGDATLAKQEEILDAIETLSTSTGTEAY